MVKYLTSFQVGIFNSMETKPTAINKIHKPNGKLSVPINFHSQKEKAK